MTDTRARSECKHCGQQIRRGRFTRVIESEDTTIFGQWVVAAAFQSARNDGWVCRSRLASQGHEPVGTW